MRERPFCSVVVRCCNEERHIGRLLTGIYEQTIGDVEVIIVDSGSEDATLAIARRYPVEIELIKPEEFSFGRALNRGCERASGEFIIVASAHVYPTRRDWLERLTEPFTDDDVALVYGKQRGAETTKYSEHRIFAHWFPEAPTPNQAHPFCNNANAAIRRALWSDVRYDETLTGLEDLDWAIRIMAGGKRLAYSAEAEVIHVHEETARAIFNRYRREALALRSISPGEGLGLLDLLKLLPANVVSDWYHAGRDGVLRERALEILQFRAMQFLGTYRGATESRLVSSRLKQTFYYPNTRRPGAAAWPSEDARVIDYARADRGRLGADEPRND